MQVIFSEDSLPSPVPAVFFEDIASAACENEGLVSPLFVCLTLTDDAGIQKINQVWRQVDAPTDVLSFPAADFSPQDTAGKRKMMPADTWDSEMSAYLLGDIMISLPRAGAQAEEYGHGFQRELAYLFAHGLLHLMGYDHQVPEDKKHMREKEELALSSARKSDLALMEVARKARESAYTPYSHYKVGAALRTKDGKIYTGCNVENASFGLTNCAERTAVFKAVSEGETEFDAIAVAADATAPWPCGACRQVLSEFAPHLKVLLTWDKGAQTAQSTLDQLLPHSFLTFEEDKK